MDNKLIQHISTTINIHRSALNFLEDLAHQVGKDISQEQKNNLDFEYSLVTTIADILEELSTRDLETIKTIDVELYELYDKLKEEK